MTNTVKSGREPLFHIIRQDTMPFTRALLVRAAGVLMAFIADGLFIFAVAKINPISVYATMFAGCFGYKSRIFSMLLEAATLLGIGVALAPAFKMKFWNIGAEGQVLMGGLCTAFVMLKFGDTMPTALLFILMPLVSIIAGAIWGLIPAVFKAYWNTNETLFTLMMNYIAISLVGACTEVWRGDLSSMPMLNQNTMSGWLPRVFGTGYGLNIIIVFVLTLVMFFYLRHTKQGYEIAVVGESENTARYAGINVKRTIIRTMAISGAVCGLCGFLIVAGKDHTISASTTAGGRGFTAIIVAWLAKFNTLTMIIISLFLAFLQVGSKFMASEYSSYGLNDFAANVITGITLLFILGCEFFINYRIVFRPRREAITPAVAGGSKEVK